MSGRVLVVDDVATNRLLLRAKLSSAYYDVVVAENGTQALELARTEQPDMVMLDVMMPDMDGFQVCEALKASVETAHIPVIMVTALDTPEERIRGLDAGADDFLSKPFNDLALFARVRNLMRMKMMFDELRLRDMTSRELGLADLVGEPEADIEVGGPILLAPPSDAAGHGLGRGAARPAERPDHRHPFGARGAEPGSARAARLLRRAPGPERRRGRAAAALGAAGEAGDASVGDHPRRRERRRADRGQGAGSRGVGLYRGAVRRQRTDRAHPLAAPAQALFRPAAHEPPQRAEAGGDRPADRDLQPPLREPAHAPGDGAGAGDRRGLRGDDDRPRQVQVDQRPLRPRCRRRGAEGVLATAAGEHPRRRPRRPVRRRGILRRHARCRQACGRRTPPSASAARSRARRCRCRAAARSRHRLDRRRHRDRRPTPTRKRSSSGPTARSTPRRKPGGTASASSPRRPDAPQ